MWATIFQNAYAIKVSIILRYYKKAMSIKICKFSFLVFVDFNYLLQCIS